MSGFTVADIIRLFREAFILSKIGQNCDEKIRSIDLGLLREGLVSVQPAQLGEILVEMPKVYWKDIGGYEEVKKTVKNVVELPLLRPEIFKKKGVSPSKGI
jgi:AAA family ATPase